MSEKRGASIEKLAEIGRNTVFGTGPDARRLNAGRRPNKLKKLIKAYDLSKNDVAALFLALVSDKTDEQLAALEADVTNPLLIRAQVRALRQQFKRGQTSALTEILEWNFGKPTQEVALSGSVTIVDDVPRE